MIDITEFIESMEDLEDHEEAVETHDQDKEFPSVWQKRMMSKSWNDNLWPIIHSFVKEQTGTTSEPLVTSSGSLLLSLSLPSRTLNTIKLEELIKLIPIEQLLDNP